MTRCPRCGTDADAGELDGMCPRCVWGQITDALPATWDDAPDLEPGRTLGEYTIVERVARGGMGVVYRARQESLGREVALKVLADPDALARFKRETTLAARLDHPNIVPVHHAGEADGVHYLAMAFVDGTSLAATRLDPRRATEIAAKIARAVQFAHDQGVLHRDLKPANVILDRAGEPRITDFGLAREIGSAPSITVSGIAMGTPPYAAPELVAGRLDEVDARTDVYAIGAILYELLAGRAPFEGKTAADVIRRVISDDPPPLKGAPADAAAICAKAMEKDRARRYASAREMADDLERALTGRPIVARATGAFGRVSRRVSRQPALAAMVAVSVVLLVLNVIQWLPRSTATTPPALAARARTVAESPSRQALADLYADLRGVPISADVWLDLGRAHAKLGERMRAIDCFSRVQDRPEAREARARVCLRDYLEHREPALWTMIEEDAARAGSASLAALVAAFEDHAAGRPAEARNKLGISIGADPVAWFLDGRCLAALGEREKAAKSFARALELDASLAPLIEKEKR